MAKKPTDKLICCWKEKFKGIDYTYPLPKHGKTLHYFFNITKGVGKMNLLDSLEEQGFDLKTLKFEIKLKKKEDS